jgi:integrase
VGNFEQRSAELQRDLLRELNIRRYSESTIKVYTIAVWHFLEYCKGRKDDLISLVKGYSFQMRRSGRSPRGANVEIYAIRFFCEHVLHQALPEGAVPRQKEPKSLPQIFTNSEISEILRVTTNPKHRLLIAIGFGCGMRINEVVHLRVKDFDNDFAFLVIRGKGEKDRKIPVDPSIAALAKVICQGKRFDDFVFDGQKPGHYISKSNAGKILAYACQKTGIRYRSFHKLRHSFATALLDSGHSTKIIQDLLGHSSVRTTEKYLHCSEAMLLKVQSPIAGMM